MGRLKRIGDLLEEGERERVGDRRILGPAENLAMHIFFLEVTRDYRYYIQRRPTIRPEIPGLPPDVRELGEYESTLLGKLLHPANPVVCVEGAMGSGKTTTINYLIQHILSRMDCDVCSLPGCTSRGKRLIAQVDFKRFFSEDVGERESDSSATDKLLRTICDELRARSIRIINDNEEYFTFWGDLIERYDRRVDTEVDPVARVLLAQAHWLREDVEQSREELRRRMDLLANLKAQDTEWYLRYLILLWRYLLQNRYAGRRDCVLVVLDNLDTLPADLQRRLLDFVMRSASKDGPTFVILMRPETRKRQGLADGLVDVVAHQGPDPLDVVLDRLERFCASPEDYYRPELGLTREQFNLIKDFVLRIREQIRDPNPFNEFIRHASGESVRLALLLAQGLLLVRVADMRNPEVTPHFLVRACITQGSQQFRASPRSPLDNLFHVGGAEEGQLLIKLRILRYIADRNGQCGLSNIRSAFTLFGYPEETIRGALNEMMRNECQILRSDGRDIYRKTWGDENETVYLTKIGEGYIEHLVYSADFMQEVMLDCYVDAGRWPKTITRDMLTDKLRLLYLFLRDLLEVDSREVRSCVDRLGPLRYSELFGPRLLSLDLIQRLYESVGRILSTAARKYPHHKHDYRDLLAQFTSLLRMAEKANGDLLGVKPECVEEISIDES